MAAETSKKEPSPSAPAKLPRISKDQKIQKRPLLHPAIAPPKRNASHPKIVYVSASSPFISVVKRVQKLLAQAEKRASTTIDLRKGGDRAILKALEADIVRSEKKGSEAITMKATGKAIAKLLQLALWFQEQDKYAVKMRTGSVGAIDDVVTVKGEEKGLEESRIRMTSSLEVAISVK